MTAFIPDSLCGKKFLGQYHHRHQHQQEHPLNQGLHNCSRRLLLCSYRFLFPHLSESAKATLTEYHRLSGLHNSNVFPQFWRLEVQVPGVGRVDFSRGLSPWFAGSSLGLPCVCLCFFFLTWTTFKVFIEFVTILLLLFISGFLAERYMGC